MAIATIFFLLAVFLMMLGIDFILTVKQICANVDPNRNWPKIPEGIGVFECMFSTDFENNENLVLSIIGIGGVVLSLVALFCIPALLASISFATILTKITLIVSFIYIILSTVYAGSLMPSSIGGIVMIILAFLYS